MSSESESDEDYAPEENPVQLSEEESADDETENQYENEVEKKKRKAAVKPESKGKKKRKTKNSEETVVEEPEEKPEEELDPETQKKKDDDLWAMFLDGTDTKPKAKQSTIEPPKPVAKSKAVVQEAKKSDATEKEKRIFEFAGETIVVENNVIKERIKSEEGPSTGVKPLARASTGGLSSLLGQIDKKNKLSTLEKSKLDWTTFKKDEGIEEEVSSHNKGKQGYLERQDFLERADYRQYEIERELRMGRRTKR